MISYHSEHSEFELKDKRKYSKWLKQIAQKEGFEVAELNYIFLTDEGLYEINMEYLNHDTYTDIITFDNSDESGVIEGDIFISVDRVKENADGFKTSFENELRRVMAHGLLHLLGYKDKSDNDEKQMREMEEKSLEMWPVV